MRVRWSGSAITIEDIEDRAALYDALGARYSYRVPGAEFTDAYARRLWDGRARLFARAAGDRLIGPPGLLADLLAHLADLGFEVEVEDARKPRPRPLGAWSGPTLRPYQGEALSAALAAPGGVLDEPVRSGKTVIASAVVHALGERACFVAPSDFLVAQARDVFTRCLSGAKVTVVGLGGDDSTGDVVIASVATLCARRRSRWWRDFREAFGVVIFDELHHLLGAGEEWRETAEGFDAGRRYGLTGTFRAADPQVRLLAHGLCGPSLHRTTLRQLTEEGHLTPLDIEFRRHDAPSLPDRAWSRSTYADGVVRCEARNRAVVAAAVEAARAGRPCLIDTAQVGHARALMGLLRGSLPSGAARLLTGASPDEERRAVLADLAAGRAKVVVSTFLGEGVDVPELAVVVNAEGGSASPSTIQRLRNLTPHPGKARALLVEMVDDHHPTLAEWTAERLRLYREERCFSIRVQPPTAATPDRSPPARGRVKPAGPEARR